MPLLPEDEVTGLENAQEQVIEPIRPKKIGELAQLKGIKVVVRGRENTFKTGSGLLFPTPEVIDLELGTADLAPFHKNRDVTVWETVVMKEKLIDAKKCFDIDKVESTYQFEIAFGEALRSKSQTIVIDSISELYDWALEFMKSAGKGLTKKKIMTSSYRELLSNKDVSGFDFGISNNIMHNTIMKGLLTNKNFYIIAQDQEIHDKNGKPTGTYKPSWMKKIPFWMPIIVNMTVESDPANRMKKYYATIEKFRGHSEVVGDKMLLMTIVGSKAILDNNLYDWLASIKKDDISFPSSLQEAKEKAKSNKVEQEKVSTPLVSIPSMVQTPPAPILSSNGEGTVLKDISTTIILGVKSSPSPTLITEKPKPTFQIPDLLM